MLILVRHGRTAANASGLLLGRSNPPLDPTGRAQADAVAAAVAGDGVRRVITSPLARCRETAAAVGAAAGVAVEVDDRWVEMDYGSFDGRSLSAIPPELWAAWRADVDWAGHGGESIAAVGRRVREACDELAVDGGEGTSGAGAVVVVSHVSPIKAAVAWALAVGDEVAWHLFVAPASITRIEGARRSLVAFNEVGHLAG